MTDTHRAVTIPVSPLPVYEASLDPGPHHIADFWVSGDGGLAGAELWRVLAGEPAATYPGPRGTRVGGTLLTPERAVRHAALDWARLAPDWTSLMGGHVGGPVLSFEATEAGLVERRTYKLDDGRLLYLLVADAGPAVYFATTPRKPAPALGTRQGRTAEAAWLWLDLEDKKALQGYFELYGAPPDIDQGGGVSPWSGMWSPEGVRWVTLGRLERLQKGLQAAVQEGGQLPGADWYRDEPPGAVWQPEYGRLGVAEDGRPQLEIDLWQAVAYRIAEDIAEGRLGSCEAPKLYSPKERCGRPFVRSRAGLSQYCSAACRSRAGTQLYLKRRLEGEHTEDPHGT